MAALEQRDGRRHKREPKFSLRFHVLVSTPLLFETGFLKIPCGDWKKKGPQPGAHWRRPVQTVRASSAMGMERKSRRGRCGLEAKSGGNFDFSHLKLICGLG